MLAYVAERLVEREIEAATGAPNGACCGTQVRSGTTCPRKAAVSRMPCASSPPGGVEMETTSGEKCS